MSKNTSQSIINASKDADLLERTTAIAAEMGIDMPQNYIGNRTLQFASQEVDTEGNTVASVYAYAYAVYNERIEAARVALEAAQKAYDDALASEKPGKNMGAVTDTHIRAALTKLTSSTTPTPTPTI